MDLSARRIHQSFSGSGHSGKPSHALHCKLHYPNRGVKVGTNSESSSLGSLRQLDLAALLAKLTAHPPSALSNYPGQCMHHPPGNRVGGRCGGRPIVPPYSPSCKTGPLLSDRTLVGPE